MLADLRTRLGVLTTVVAVIAAGTVAAVAQHELRDSLHAERRRAIRAAAQHGQTHLQRLVERLAFESLDYAVWDELYEQAPDPDEAWAAINLRPGDARGRMSYAFAIVAEGRVVARFRRGARYRAETDEDPVPNAVLASLAHSEAWSGLAAAGTRPIAVATAPILRSDGSGPARGALLAWCYLDQPDIAAELQLPRHRLDLSVAPATTDRQAALLWDGAAYALRQPLPAVGDGSVLLQVSELPADDDMLGRTVAVMLAASAVCAALVALIGTLVGWRWMRSFRLLAEACDRRRLAPDSPLPAVDELAEARTLREALERLAQAERDYRERLLDAWQRERHTSALLQRSFAHLYHDLSYPLHALAATIEQAARTGATAAELSALREQALALEGRLQAALGAIGIDPRAEPQALAAARDLGSYLNEVAALLAPLAASCGGAVATDGQGQARVNAALMTPILINLASNALHARRGARVLLAAHAGAQGVRWGVRDDAGGLPPPLAQAIAEACQRGHIIPGTAGIGLGWAVIIDHARALQARISIDNRPGEGLTVHIDTPPSGVG